jgi:hypothetical protein
MAVIGQVGLSPLDRIIVTITCISAQFDMTITKRGERNVIRVCRSDKGLALEDDSTDDTIKSSYASCGDLNIKTKNTEIEVNILGRDRATDRVFSNSMSLVKMRSMSSVRCKDQVSQETKNTKVKLGDQRHGIGIELN